MRLRPASSALGQEASSDPVGHLPHGPSATGEGDNLKKFLPSTVRRMGEGGRRPDEGSSRVRRAAKIFGACRQRARSAVLWTDQSKGDHHVEAYTYQKHLQAQFSRAQQRQLRRIKKLPNPDMQRLTVSNTTTRSPARASRCSSSMAGWVRSTCSTRCSRSWLNTVR